MGNHDIIVVERVSIPNFSKPGNIGTLLKLYESFFDDALVDIYLVTPSCTVIERKQTLVLKSLMKHFAYP